MRQFQLILILVLGYCIYCVDLLAKNDSDPSTLNKTEVKTKVNENLKIPVVLQDLAYGNILFEYYRGKSIDALNAILMAEKNNLLPNHQQSARLLSGVIYLDLGMISNAQKIFDELLTDDNLKSEILARLEFYLAKILYRQGDHTLAEIKLSKVVSNLELSLKDQALIMLSNIAIEKDQKNKARDWLKEVSQDSTLGLFSRYNLGISYLKDANINDALVVLNPLIQQTIPIAKMEYDNLNNIHINHSLEDKAKVAIGYFYLSQKKFDKARESLLTVRLNTLEANQALLGMGWSYLGDKLYQKALSHWLALANKDKRDMAVQEALLAIPYAYKQLNAQQQAFDSYLDASAIYQQQLDLINQIVFEINNDELIEKKLINLLENNELKLSTLGIKDSNILGENLNYYLFELMSQNQFNEDVVSFQQLEILINLLSHWKKQLPMFNEMLLVNKKRFAEKMPMVDQYLASDMSDNYQTQLDRLETDISDIKVNKKLYLLADKKQLSLYHRISSLLAKLSNLPEDMISDEQRTKVSRAKGVLYWQLQTNKADKIWKLEKNLQEIKKMLAELKNNKNSLLNARVDSTKRFSGFQEKIIIDTDKLILLEDKLKLEINNQLNQIKQKILMVLAKRKKSLENFILQSDLEIARINGQSILIPEID